MEYERLTDYVDARVDGAQSIGLAADYLRLDIGYDNFSLTNIKKYLRQNIPVATTVKDEKYDYHTILIVDYKKDMNNTYLRIPNWQNRQWVTWDFLKSMMVNCHKRELGIIGNRPLKLLHTIKLDDRHDNEFGN
jgi:hypothetical protein